MHRCISVQRREVIAGRLVVPIIVAGIASRILVAAVAGAPFDLNNIRLAGDLFRTWGFDVYAHLGGHPIPTFPYPPGMLPWAAAATEAGRWFPFVERLPPIAADAGIAWVVGAFLKDLGVEPVRRLAAVALVSFGPTLFLTSGVEGQLDSLAILPALVAFRLWYLDTSHRALKVGLLLGVGASVKTVPIFLLVALLPHVRSLREAVVLSSSAIAVPIAALAPFLADQPHAVVDVLTYNGLGGIGGLSAVLRDVPALRSFLEANALVLQLLALGLVFAASLRLAVTPLWSACFLWLLIWVMGVNWFPQYLVWGIPFLLASGSTRAVLLLNVAVLGFAVQHAGLNIPAFEHSYIELRPAIDHVSAIVMWLLCAGLLVRHVLDAIATARRKERAATPGSAATPPARRPAVPPAPPAGP
jgi:hypothetical protein